MTKTLRWSASCSRSQQSSNKKLLWTNLAARHFYLPCTPLWLCLSCTPPKGSRTVHLVTVEHRVQALQSSMPWDVEASRWLVSCWITSLRSCSRINYSNTSFSKPKKGPVPLIEVCLQCTISIGKDSVTLFVKILGCLLFHNLLGFFFSRGKHHSWPLSVAGLSTALSCQVQLAPAFCRVTTWKFTWYKSINWSSLERDSECIRFPCCL